MSSPWINATVTYQEIWERTTEVSLDEETVRYWVNGANEPFIGPLSPDQIAEYLQSTYSDGDADWMKTTYPAYDDEFITLDVERVVMQP